MKKIYSTLFLAVFAFAFAHAQEPAPLFFTTYIEGSSNNKAIEIFNPGDTAVHLDNYQIAQSVNGGGWEYYHTFPAGSILEPKDVWVILNDAVDTNLFSPTKADEFLAYPSVTHHNGDDARAIIFITPTETIFLDLIGDPLSDPGAGWDVAGVTEATKDHSLVRKAHVQKGNMNWTASAGTTAENSQWVVLDQNKFDSLGFHTLGEAIASSDASISDLLVDGETVTGFSPAQLSYSVILGPSVTTPPAITVQTNDANAVVKVTDATNLSGTEAERTSTVLITSEDGSATKTYTVVFTLAVGISNSNVDVIDIYPVPAMEYLNVKNLGGYDKISILSITGATLRMIETGRETEIQLDVSGLSSGTYFLNLSGDQGLKAIRFIKK